MISSNRRNAAKSSTDRRMNSPVRLPTLAVWRWNPGDSRVSVARPGPLRWLGWRLRYGADGDGFDALVSTAVAWTACRGRGFAGLAEGARPCRAGGCATTTCL